MGVLVVLVGGIERLNQPVWAEDQGTWYLVCWSKGLVPKSKSLTLERKVLKSAGSFIVYY